ncbi:hypothetical protein Areg01_38920 [Actinoplanes regularis]|nr:hypothetical protein Areg01_38920 [Actinoplanes regularis]
MVMDVADWTFIDGTMDNEVQGIRERSWREDGQDPAWAELEQLGASIRQAGWEQLPDWPDTYEALQSWPTPGRTEAMRLSARQWGLVVTALESGADIDEPEDAATSRRIAALVRERLADQGLDPVPVVRSRSD